MKIISKKAAMYIHTNSLFVPVNGRTLKVGRFDSGKYEWTGKASSYIGRDVPDIGGVHAVYVERRQDRDGPYAQIMSIHE